MESKAAHLRSSRLCFAPAYGRNLECIRRLHHEVYATELDQHPENPSGELRDGLDGFNH